MSEFKSSCQLLVGQILISSLYASISPSEKVVVKINESIQVECTEQGLNRLNTQCELLLFCLLLLFLQDFA